MKLTFDDIKNIVSMNKARNATYIELYKKFYSRVIDRQVELDRSIATAWMANISSPVTYMICMGVFGMYQDSKVAFEVYKTIKKAKWEELTDEDTNNAELTSNAFITLFESIYEKSDWSEEFDMSILDAIILGNGFGGIGYEKSEDEYEIMTSDWKKEKILEQISMPNVYRIIPLNFFTEISANSQRKAKVNIVRKIKTIDRINADYKAYWVTYTKKENKGTILEWKDRNMVFRYMMFNNMPHTTTLKSLWITDTYGGQNGSWFDWQKHTDIWTDNSYKIGDDLHEIYEIHTDKTVQIFIDGEDNRGLLARLWPWKEKPFYKLAFRDGLNGLYDMWVGMLAYPYHKVIDSFLNMRIDNDRLSWSAPLLVNSDETMFDGVDVMSRYPGKLLKVKDVDKSTKKMEIGTSGAWAANTEVDLLGKMVQDAVGISWYKMGVQQKVERSAKWVNELVEAADAAMKSFISSIAKAKWFIAKYVVMLALNYMDDETIEKMSGMTDLKTKVDLTDFINDYSFNFNIESISSLRERQEIDLLRNTIRDYWQITRPSGTPVLNQDEAFQEILEKTRLPSKLYLSEEDAFEYMKAQVKQNADLKKLETESMPQPPMVDWKQQPLEWGIVPGFNVQADAEKTMWAAPTPGVQWWSSWAGMSQVTNVSWANQEAWQTL